MTKRRQKSRSHKRGTLVRSAARALPQAKPFTECVYRIADRGFADADTLISGLGAMHYGGRWNAAGEFPVFYAALDLATAYEEKTYSNRRYAIPPEQWLPAVIVLVEVKLARVLDLTLPATRNQFGITPEAMVAERLASSGKSSHETARHAIARAARRAGIEALIVPSARNPGGKNLAVFVENLGKSSSLLIVNPENLPGKS
jgi:RES domain-containing protein